MEKADWTEQEFTPTLDHPIEHAANPEDRAEPALVIDAEGEVRVPFLAVMFFGLRGSYEQREVVLVKVLSVLLAMLLDSLVRLTPRLL